MWLHVHIDYKCQVISTEGTDSNIERAFEDDITARVFDQCHHMHVFIIQ